MTTYGDSLAAVGLHPDNPDEMYAQLMVFLKAPKAFKDADKLWRGTKDNLSWYEDPKGTAHCIWPFHYGLWASQGPTNDAQLRAVFKIPDGTATGAFLSKLYGFPMTFKTYNLIIDHYDGGLMAGTSTGLEGVNVGFDVGRAVDSAVDAVVGVANTLHIPMVNITAALLTGKDPIAALKADVDSFMQAGAIAKGVVSGDLKPLAQQAVNAAASFGVHLDAGQVQAVADAASSGDPTKAAVAAMGDAYASAWDQATKGGTVYDAKLPPPPGKSYAASALPRAAPPRVGTKAILDAAAKGMSGAPGKKYTPFITAAGGAGLGAVVGGPVGALLGGILGLLGGLALSKSG